MLTLPIEEILAKPLEDQAWTHPLDTGDGSWDGGTDGRIHPLQAGAPSPGPGRRRRNSRNCNKKLEYKH
jgi:hypothetical protein